MWWRCCCGAAGWVEARRPSRIQAGLASVEKLTVLRPLAFAAISAIEALHIEIHGRAAAMISFKQLGRTDALLERMEEFYRLLAQLLEMLRQSTCN